MFFLTVFSIRAQEMEKTDSLHHSIIVSENRMFLSVGRIVTRKENMLAVTSPLGEGDPLRWIQTLPGVMTGADGTNTVFVRGGNISGNLITIDGVPVYGYSHLLGLTTIISPDAISSVSFAKGGFGGKQGNFTSSHIEIMSSRPSPSSIQGSVSINTFLLGANVQGGIGKKLSFNVAGRISPLQWEYRAIRGLLKNAWANLDDFKVGVYDLYGTAAYQFDSKTWCSVSSLFTQDSYSYFTQDNSYEQIGWRNHLGIFRFHRSTSAADWDISASYNSYEGLQLQDKQYRGKDNHFSLISTLREITLSGDARIPMGRLLELKCGTKAQMASFAPGSVGEVIDKRLSLLSSTYLQGVFSWDSLEIEGTVRGNLFKSNTWFIRPDFNFLAKWSILKSFSLEATFDYMSQFYHSLEGLPLGWSVDMIVPSSALVPEEKMLQGYVGTEFCSGPNRILAGVYVKRQENLVYYKNAKSFFSTSFAGWETQVDIGNGISYGAELLYEYQGKDFYARISATLSKATREGFLLINDGKPFHAPFDRGIVVNSSAEWRGIRLSFIYQGGNWVNGRGEQYQLPSLDGEMVPLMYYESVNNHQMPPVIRLDISYSRKWRKDRLTHALQLGVCNLLNRFNPYTVYYDTIDETWKELALLPILPNFSYRFCF